MVGEGGIQTLPLAGRHMVRVLGSGDQEVGAGSWELGAGS